MLRTRFTELLGCSVPIQLAAMPGVVTPELAIAVSEAGGLGMISAMRLSPQGLSDLLDFIQARTAKPVGVNFLMPFLDRDGLVAAAAKGRVVEFFYGDPDSDLVKLAHRNGALVSWQIGSAEEAVAAERAGCDFIVAQGVESGGHIRGTNGILPLLSSILDTVGVPVLAAGGIGTARDLAAVVAAGASGARLGTRFLACAESGAHPAYVDAIIKSRAEDTVVTETFSATWPHAPHRVLRACVEAANSSQRSTVAEMQVNGSKLSIPRFGSPAPTKDTVGAIEAMALYAGQSVTAVTSIESAAQIVKELAEGAQKLLKPDEK